MAQLLTNTARRVNIILRSVLRGGFECNKLLRKLLNFGTDSKLIHRLLSVLDATQSLATQIFANCGLHLGIKKADGLAACCLRPVLRQISLFKQFLH
jgi:hypothetical protein